MARTRPDQVRQRVVHDRFAAVVDREHQEYRGGCQRREYGVAAEHRRHSADPSVNPAVPNSHDVEHVPGQRRRPLRLHRRLAIAVSCLRHGGRAAYWRRIHRTQRSRPLAGNSPGRYFTVRAGSLVAWNSPTVPGGPPFRIIGAHTDSPNLRVKQHPDRSVAGWQVVALEPYGGAWLNSWLDRDLGISGRLSVRRRLRLSRSPAGPGRRSDPAGTAAGHPSGRGSGVTQVGSAATRQRSVGDRRRRRGRSSGTPRSGPGCRPPTCCRPT